MRKSPSFLIGYVLVCGMLISCLKDREPQVVLPPLVTTCDLVSIDPRDEPSQLSRLRVVGNRIVDNNCKRIILKGVAIIDPLFIVEYEGGFKTELFKSLKEDWKVNILRVPIHPDLWRHYPAYAEKYLDPIVAFGNQFGFYVLLGYHAHGNIITGQSEDVGWKNRLPWRGNPYDSDRALAVDALTKLTQRYHRKPWVLYGSFNEPVFIAWNEWHLEAAKLVDVIHAVDGRALVTVSGTDWGYDLSGLLYQPLNRPNVIYETHPYPWKGEGWKEVVARLSPYYPIILGEWGFEGELVRSYGLPLLDFCRENQIGRLAWIWHHDWSPAIFKNSAQGLTSFGELVKEDLGRE